MVESNAHTVSRELDWFQQVILLRGKITFEQSASEVEMDKLVPPSLENQISPYAKLIGEYQMNMFLSWP